LALGTLVNVVNTGIYTRTRVMSNIGFVT